MKTLKVLVLLQFCILSIISGQKDSTEFIYRDWYASGYGYKELNIGDIITLDTIKLDAKDNHNFMKWEFKRNGDLINLYVYVIQEGKFKGEVMGISNDDTKWEIKKGTSDLIIDNGIIEGYGNYKAKYKILKLTNSKLILSKLNTMQCPKGK